MTKRRKKKNLKISIARNTVIGLGLITVSYLLFSIVFMNRFYPGTTVNGIKASFASAESMEERISRSAKDYSIKIESNGSVIGEITGTDIDLKSDPKDGEIETMLDSQIGFDWPVKIFKPDSYVGDRLVSFNETKLRNKVNSFGFINKFTANKTEDAYYIYKNGQYAIVNEVYGEDFDKEEFTSKIGDLIIRLHRSADLEKDMLYKQPAIKSDDEKLVAFVDKLNKNLNRKIEFEEGFAISKDEISDWIVEDGKTIDYDKEKVTEYVKGLRKTYNTLGKPKELKTSYGTTVTVPGGNYGWRIDVDGEVEQLISDLKGSEDVKREMVYEYTAASHDEQDYGNSYVEVNLSEQHLFLYIDGECVLDTPFVSGNLAKGYGTHTGAYRIAYCQKDAILRGADYATPVKFWMPFNNGEGLHDATWRRSFGGNIFRTSGSHGCVNLPYSAAEKIFGLVKAGFPVLVYSTGGTDNTYTAVPQPETAQTVAEKIAAIGKVTLESEAAIIEAQNAYNGLSEEEKSQVENISILTTAEAELQKLKSAPVNPATPAPPDWLSPVEPIDTPPAQQPSEIQPDTIPTEEPPAEETQNTQAI